ncbi:MAG: response regulator [Polaromonas sp.]|nr:response regulator [Polaromonas sp.]
MHKQAEPFRVFLVEDNPLIRESLIEHIEELLPADVIAWEHSEKASVDWLKANAFMWDVAVVDLFLQEGSGLGVAKSQEKRAVTQKLVVLSNYATEEIRKRCMAIGVDAVFDKSNELEEFTVFMLEVARSKGH